MLIFKCQSCSDTHIIILLHTHSINDTTTTFYLLEPFAIRRKKDVNPPCQSHDLQLGQMMKAVLRFNAPWTSIASFLPFPTRSLSYHLLNQTFPCGAPNILCFRFRQNHFHVENCQKLPGRFTVRSGSVSDPLDLEEPLWHRCQNMPSCLVQTNHDTTFVVSTGLWRQVILNRCVLLLNLLQVMDSVLPRPSIPSLSWWRCSKRLARMSGRFKFI